MRTKETGQRGEEAAWRYLRRRGYHLVTTNYACRGGEIDIIAKDKGTLVFVEVRSRSNARYGLPMETVDAGKQQRIRRAAEHYLHSTGQMEAYCRFDVVSILWQENGKPLIELYKDAF